MSQLFCPEVQDDPQHPCMYFTNDTTGNWVRYDGREHMTGAPWHTTATRVNEAPDLDNEDWVCNDHGEVAEVVNDVHAQLDRIRDRDGWRYCEGCDRWEIDPCPYSPRSMHGLDPEDIDEALHRRMSTNLKPQVFDTLLVGYGEPDFTQLM